MKNTLIIKTVGLVTAFALVFGAAVPSASAITANELLDLLIATGVIASDKVDAAKAALGTTGSGACGAFSRDLTLGSTGSDVVDLQTSLVNMGHLVMPTGVSMGYFGPLTKSAVASYQSAKGITPAVGYFGPITRASFSGSCSDDSDSGDSDNGGDNSLSGGAGSVDTYTLVSGYNNEEVGEGASAVPVYGLEVEVDDGSDLRFTAVKVVFAQGTADNGDFEDYADEVSVLLDGEEVATVDADEFTDDNSYTKTLTLESGAIIREGDTGEFTIEVSGANNIDSGDLSETWTVDISQLRFKDATGATISEDPGTAARTFSFASFATSADVELKVTSGDSDINDARVIEVDESDDTDGVELFSFNLEAKGDSDLTIDDLPITFVTVGADLDGIANTVYLYVDGEEVGSESVPSTATTTTLLTFSDLDWTLDAGDKVEVVVMADLNDIDAGTFDEGDTLYAQFTENETDNPAFDVEDEEGDDLSDADKTGGTTGSAHSFNSDGIMVSLVSISESTTVQDSADNDTATFIIKYDVTAFGSDIYVSDTPRATISDTIAETWLNASTAGGALYLVDQSGTATTTDLTGTVLTFTSNGSKVTDTGVTNGVKVSENETGHFTLTVVRTNSGGADNDGSYRAALKAISWATTDSAVQSIYDFDLEDFESDYVFIN